MEKHLPSRVCIVTTDIPGPIRNGGIGSAYYSLARLLAAAGHSVTILYALGSYTEQRPVSHWVRVYRRWDIELVPLPTPHGPELKGSVHVRIAWNVYRWLAARTFDVVHFHEWRGIAFYALQARRQGLCLQRTVTVVGAHSPSFWQKEGMHQLPQGIDDVELDHLERESVALADVLWSPSAHMVRWMKAHRWQLPDEQFVHPYVILERDADAPRVRAKVSEVCFFGRLEKRKGVDLFCAAITRLVERGTIPASVTFLGKAASVDGVESEEYLAGQAAAWPMPWRVVSTFDRHQAMDYLRGSGRLAVLPSRLDNLPYTVLECLGAGIPFVASAVGGIPEMIRAADRPSVLFELRPDALADAVHSALTTGLRPARFRNAPEQTDAAWLTFHDEVTRRARARRVPKQPRRRPLVSVCITHHDRPALLRQALDSIRRQTYGRFEVVLVDDGSRKPETRAALDALEPEFKRRGWSIVRQANRYLGAARNAAAQQARGEYLLFMDDDNCAKSDAIESFVRSAETSGADVVTCFLDVFRGAAPPGRGPAAYRWPFIGGALGVGLTRNCFGDANCLVRANVYRALGGMTEDFGVSGEDWEFFAKAVIKGYRVVVVPEALAWYRSSPAGMWSTTSSSANRLRALRPYRAAASVGLLAALPLCQASPQAEVTDGPALDATHVRNVVIFGAGEGGRRAAMLARRCGWDVRYVVDNNESTWGGTAHGYDVRQPSSLGARDFDMVLVASMAGRQTLSGQLEKMGFTYGSNYAYFLDAFATDGLRMQLVM